MKTVLTVLATAILFCFLASSCAVNRTIPNRHLDQSIVPPDFDPQKHVILVVRLPRDRRGKLNRQMTELFTKYYPAKFEIVESEELKASYRKYSDTFIYKYAVVNSLSGYTHSTTTTVTHTTSMGSNTHSVSPSATTTYISYRFVDRTNNQQYGLSYPSPWLKTTVQAFANTVKKAKHIE